MYIFILAERALLPPLPPQAKGQGGQLPPCPPVPASLKTLTLIEAGLPLAKKDGITKKICFSHLNLPHSSCNLTEFA